MNLYKINFIFLFCICNFYFGYAQSKSEYRCAYQLEYLKDTLSIEYFRPEIYIVQIGDGLTKGFTYQKFYIDSLKSSNPRLYKEMFNASIKESIEAMKKSGDVSQVHNNPFHYGEFSSELYKDYKKKEIRVKDNVSTYEYIYTDELQPQDWQIVTDTTTILGYSSQKAICHYRGRDWVAWFTTEIPISEGPWKFYGLPGLITEIHDTKKHYSFELIGFQKKEEDMEIKLPRTAQKIERKEFIRAKMGKTEERINESEMAKVGLSSSDRNPTQHYDYIELDYKEE